MNTSLFALTAAAVMVSTLAAFGGGLTERGEPTVVFTPALSEEPAWEFGLRALALQRTGLDSVPLVVDGAAILLSADDYNGDLGTGFEVWATRDLGGPNSLRFGGFSLSSTDTSRMFTAAGAQFTVYGAAFGLHPITVDYQSDLMGVEATFRREMPGDRLTLFGGLRAMRLDESMSVVDILSPPNLFIGDLENNLRGVHIGAEASLVQSDRWDVVGGVDLGVYANDADLRAAFPQAGPAAVFDASGTSTARSAQIRLAATYNFSDNASFEFGYQAMRLSDVALYPEQLDDLAVPILGEMDMGGSVLYQGLTLGLQFTW